MKGFEIIKKENKFYIRNEFFGDMMIYGIKTLKPYIRRLSEKIYLTQEMNVKLKSMMQ